MSYSFHKINDYLNRNTSLNDLKRNKNAFESEVKVLYNEEIKKEYIYFKKSSTTIYKNYLERSFKKVGVYENELGKDLSDFTKDEIINYYKMLNATSIDSLSVLHSYFSQYVQWCIQRNLTKSQNNVFKEITVKTLGECLNKHLINKRIFSREQLIYWCELIPNPRDKFVLLALFEGLNGQNYCEITELKKEDVENNTLTLCTGRKIDASDLLIEYIYESLDCFTYAPVTGTSHRTYKLIGKDYVFKRHYNTKDDENSFTMGRNVYNSVMRNLVYLGISDYITFRDIVRSGEIHEVLSLSEKYGITTKEILFSDKIEEINKKFNCNIVRSIYWHKYKDYLER